MALGRSLFKEAFKAFINSLKPKNIWGVLIGKDYLGTEYYESQTNSHKRKPVRWYTPVNKSDEFQQEIPPEWEAWLRHRRKDPPTEEEIQYNIQKMKNTIQNAKMLEKQRNKTISDTKNLSSETKYPNADCSVSPSNTKEDKDLP